MSPKVDQVVLRQWGIDKYQTSGHSSLNNVPILNIIGLIDLKNNIRYWHKAVLNARNVRFGGKADIRLVPITVFIGGNCQDFFGGDWEKRKTSLIKLGQRYARRF